MRQECQEPLLILYNGFAKQPTSDSRLPASFHAMATCTHPLFHCRSLLPSSFCSSSSYLLDPQALNLHLPSLPVSSSLFSL